MKNDGDDRAGLPRVSGRGSAQPSKGGTVATVAKVDFDLRTPVPGAGPGGTGRAAGESGASPPAGSGEETGFGETIVGLAALCAILVIGYLIWSLFWIGRPASFLSVVALALAGIFHLVAAWIKEAETRRKRLSMRIAGGLVGDSSRAALWTGIGLAVVWLFQLILNFLPGFVGVDRALDLQLQAWDAADGLKSAVTPGRFLIVILGAVAVAVAAGTVWPVNAVGTAKKWAGIAASLLIAFASMTFVSVEAGSARYAEHGVAPIRGEIGADLQRLRQARKDHAALQWLGSILQKQVAESPADARAWREYLHLAAERCEAAERRFQSGVESYPNREFYDRPTYCLTQDYLPELVERRFHVPAAEPAAAEEPSRWLPEFRDLRVTAIDAGGEFETLEVERVPRRLQDLRAFAARVKQQANDQERAREGVESAVTALVASMVGEAESGVAREVLGKLKGAVLKALARDSRERVALWLRMKDVPLPQVARLIVGIEPELRLESPRRAMEAAGGAESLVEQTWSADYRAVDLERLGRTTAIDQHDRAAQHRQDRARDHKRMQDAIEQAARRRGGKR